MHVRDEPAVQTLQLRGRVDHADYAPFLDAAYPALYTMLERLGAPPGGPPGALYPAEVAETDEVVAYVPVAEPVQLPADRGPIALGELPSAVVAVLTHHGGYDSIGDSYQLLGRWVAEHAVSAEAPVREVYLIGPAQTTDPTACAPRSAGR